MSHFCGLQGGGEVDATVASLPASLPYIREGELRALAVMSEARDPLVPDVPTFQELGFDVVYGGFRVVAVPKGTPIAIVDKLEETWRAASEDAEFQAWAETAVIGAHYRSAHATRAYLRQTAEKVEALMRALELTP